MKHPKVEIQIEYFRQRERYLAFLAGLQNVIPLLVAREGLKFQGVYGRVKSPESLLEKLNRKDKYSTLSDITRNVANLRNSVIDEYPQHSNREGPVTTGNLRCV